MGLNRWWDTLPDFSTSEDLCSLTRVLECLSILWQQRKELKALLKNKILNVPFGLLALVRVGFGGAFLLSNLRYLTKTNNISYWIKFFFIISWTQSLLRNDWWIELCLLIIVHNWHNYLYFINDQFGIWWIRTCSFKPIIIIIFPTTDYFIFLSHQHLGITRTCFKKIYMIPQSCKIKIFN